MSLLRRHRRWSLLPLMVWLLTQLVMTGAFAAPNGATLSPAERLIAQIVSGQGLCSVTASAEATQDGSTPAKPGPGCDWCHSFGVMPMLAPPPDGVRSSLRVSVRLAHAPTETRYAEAHGAHGFLSRAPPL